MREQHVQHRLGRPTSPCLFCVMENIQSRRGRLEVESNIIYIYLRCSSDFYTYRNGFVFFSPLQMQMRIAYSKTRTLHKIFPNIYGNFYGTLYTRALAPLSSANFAAGWRKCTMISRINMPFMYSTRFAVKYSHVQARCGA